MSFRRRFEQMAEGLRANPNVRLLRLDFGNGAPAAEVEAARRAAGGRLPDGAEEFFGEMNGFGLEWEHTVEAVKRHDDSDKGFVNILPLGRIFGDWKGVTWFDDFQGGDRHRPVRPLDQFVPEACAAFYQDASRPARNTVHYHYFGEALEDTRYTFPEYVDRLVASRGYFYWLLTLCEGSQSRPEVAAFRKNMPLIFDDYDDRLFRPAAAGRGGA